ncbi:hypothetical protein DAPPUDRAFT_331063 [Daphnia pulex]|uniref:DEAD/DEAH-box helicase domain-containing protein n=1 Tax=Daphnia pulex TaxID=6669 RepID=E9HLE0_DAPPU|nr:hypothetical protein DAPPUDRAFT_331063 [Daphnia pulex]|eukprot:EFX67418.1 hypothetical protein DAPPUDRAFT_331063 [Daphnia pulex]
MNLFGFSILKPQQQEVIDAVLAGKDCLAVMPNGGGKSACYVLTSINKLGTKVSEIQSVEEANIKKAVAFCENRTVCRNFKINNYLDENPITCSVDSISCLDICRSNERYIEVDVVKEVQVTQCAMYGKGNGWSKKNAFKLIHKLILDDVLQEQLIFAKD